MAPHIRKRGTVYVWMVSFTLWLLYPPGSQRQARSPRSV